MSYFLTQRHYEQMEIAEVVETILGEVRTAGVSEGWCGDIETKDRLEELLKPLGVAYVDDMRGCWRAG